MGIHLWSVLEAASFQVLCPELEHARTDGKILALHKRKSFEKKETEVVDKMR